MFPRSCIAGLAALATLSAPVVSLAGPIITSPSASGSGDGAGKVIWPTGAAITVGPTIKSGYAGYISKMTPGEKHPSSTKWVKDAPKSPASPTSGSSTQTTSGDVQGAFNPNQGAVVVGGVPITIIYTPQN